jgi:tetratricopeptide (TPR) repeat protein
VAIVEKAGSGFPTGPNRFEDLWMRRDYDGAERLARTNADTARPGRAVGAQDALVWIAMVRGRLREAERRYVQVNEAKARVRGDTVSPHDVAFLHAMIDGQLRGDVAKGLAALDAAQRDAPPASLPSTKDRSIFLALGYARLGVVGKARELLNGYEARLDAMGRRQQAVNLNRLRGEIARAEGKTDSAVAYFRRGDAEADGLPTRNCSVCTPFLLGYAFDRSGNADSARTYLTQYVETNGTGRTFADRYWLAPTLFRLGELYENIGDVRHATEYYGRFVDLWKNADPEVQPRVTDARGRIDRMNRANHPPLPISDAGEPRSVTRPSSITYTMSA